MAEKAEQVEQRVQESGQRIAVRGKGAENEYRVYLVSLEQNPAEKELSGDLLVGKVLREQKQLKVGKPKREVWSNSLSEGPFERRKDAIVDLVAVAIGFGE